MKNGPLTALRDGDSPQFEMDFLGGEGGGRIGDSPRDLAPCVRVSRRARRLSVRVYPDARVEVVVPPRVRPREIEQFVAAHREWIDSKRAAALARRPAPEAFPPASIAFAFTGEAWRLHVAGGAGGARLKEIGTRARVDIETLLGRRVFLNLFVKVRESWRDDERALDELGIR